MLRSKIEPRWRHQACLLRPRYPSELLDWLFEPNSMTARLRRVGDNQLQVRLLSQQWQQPRRSEAVALNLPWRQPAVIREVELVVKGAVWIFARSVYPKAVLTGHGVCLRSLGTKPVGDVLYTDPTIARSDFEVTILRPGQVDFIKATRSLVTKPDYLLARRSVFRWYNKPLLISEIFLPTILENQHD